MPSIIGVVSFAIDDYIWLQPFVWITVLYYNNDFPFYKFGKNIDITKFKHSSLLCKQASVIV